MKYSPSVYSGQGGFTLMEAVLVMVITSIIAGSLVLFIRMPVQNYVDAAGRAELSDTADLALRRMVRELHGALSNSVRIYDNGTVTVLEFIPTSAAGVYQAVEDNLASGSPLDFQVAGNKNFTVLSAMPAAPYAIVAGNSIVVNNLGEGFQDADAYAAISASNASNRALVSVTPPLNSSLVTLSANPFAGPFNASPSRPPNVSAQQRFSVVSQPVSFRCVRDAAGTGTLTRIWNYDFLSPQVDPNAVSNASKRTALMANNVVDCAFSYNLLPASPVGVAVMSITLARPGSTEFVTLAQQIHVENSP